MGTIYMKKNSKMTYQELDKKSFYIFTFWCMRLSENIYINNKIIKGNTIMEELNDLQIVQIIGTIVTRHGCEIIEMDLNNYILDIDGPAEAKRECAKELQIFLG